MTCTNEIFDVIIVGCGAAGIAAAIELQTIPPLKFILLEARNRVGGRIVTDTTTFDINTPVDLGAQWVHHFRPEHPLYKYNELSKDIHINNHFIFRSLATPFFDIDGTRISSNKIQKAEEISNRLCNIIKESSLSIDKSMFDVIKSEYIQYNNDPQMKRLIDLFLGIIEQYEASNLDQLSAKSYLLSDNGIDEYNLSMPNGFGIFIENVVQQHQLPVELNSIVTRIDTSLSNSIVRIYTKDERLFLCKYVLITIPLGCLKAHSIEFIPSLPEWKQNAIDIMGVGLSNKIFLQFPFVFWDPTWYSILCTSPQFRFILCRPNECMLQIKLAARTALEFEEKNDKDIIDKVMILLRTIFSDRNVPEPTRFLITKWNQDEFSKGAYSNFAIGADNQTLIDLARECNDRIYWAGEHANYDGTIGCVDSALESGEHSGSDNGLYNNAPVATVMSPIDISQNQQKVINIPIGDADGDTLRCQWPSGTTECGNVCLPGSLSNADPMNWPLIGSIIGLVVFSICTLCSCLYRIPTSWRIYQKNGPFKLFHIDRCTDRECQWSCTSMSPNMKFPTKVKNDHAYDILNESSNNSTTNDVSLSKSLTSTTSCSTEDENDLSTIDFHSNSFLSMDDNYSRSTSFDLDNVSVIKVKKVNKIYSALNSDIKPPIRRSNENADSSVQPSINSGTVRVSQIKSSTKKKLNTLNNESVAQHEENSVIDLTNAVRVTHVPSPITKVHSTSAPICRPSIVENTIQLDENVKTRSSSGSSKKKNKDKVYVKSI
ncbi:unnamed protein product [Rotaria sordida]|uniref:Amine oxidase domain-containing protein n=1 Tax=Rotaria sordida TaxID=392033 RepID=A0A819E6F2_9BILA|nr:unnamed protein product [Rotaria sordida]